MFKVKPEYTYCDKEIKGNEVVFVKMRYPERKGMTLKSRLFYRMKEN